MFPDEASARDAARASFVDHWTQKCRRAGNLSVDRPLGRF
jgi:hypothetical protein